jgi:hypothetical protein
MIWNPSKRKAFLTLLPLILLVSACRFYNEKMGYVTYQNGWSCRTYTDYLSSGASPRNGHECQVICANGTAGPPQDVADPLQLETVDLGGFCGLPTSTATVRAGESTATLPPSTPTVTPSPVLPLLADEMTSCGKNNQLGWWVNFRFAEPRVDIAAQDLQVTIGGARVPCGTNQANPSLLTCFVSQTLTDPADVIVQLDGVEVNRFPVTLSEETCSGATPVAPTGDGANPEPERTSTSEAAPATEAPTTAATP